MVATDATKGLSGCSRAVLVWMLMFRMCGGVLIAGIAALPCGCQTEAKPNTAPAVAPAPARKLPVKEAPPAEPETIDVTFFAELDPLQVEEVIEIGFHAKGGPIQPQTRLAVASLNLTRAEPKKTATVQLKYNFEYQLKIDARMRLDYNGETVTGSGSGLGPSSFDTDRRQFRIRADTSESKLAVDPVLGYAMRYDVRIDQVTDRTKGTGKDFTFLAAQIGSLGIARVILTSGTPIVKGAEVWVEADGQRLVPWPVGTTRVEFLVPSGGRTISVMSMVQGQRREVFRKAINAAPGSTQTLVAGG
jgi:hypothetical protein